MIIKNVQEFAERCSGIIHVLIPEDYGTISSIMKYYVDFLRKLPEDTSAEQNAMHVLYLGVYEYLDQNQDRALALLQHLGVDKIEFYNGELPLGVLEVYYEEETV
mgnify:CR=1 FL=1